MIKKGYQKKPKAAAPQQADEIRLNKYIAAAGLCSRREADEMISAGKVKVNGEIVKELGVKVKPSDRIQVEGKSISAEAYVYLLLHKPKNTITTASDEKGRKTVMDVIDPKLKTRVVPVGRLDRNTTGTMLFTNDGELAHRLLHPSYTIEKVYVAELNRAITSKDMNALLSGVELEDGVAKAYYAELLDDSGKSIRLGVHEGRNHLIRRMFTYLGYEVERLKRTKFASLDTKGLIAGKWRYLREKEVNTLRGMVGLKPIKLRKQS